MSDGVATAEAPWGVGVLGDKLKGWIDRLGQVWVEGEITQWGVRGTNVYGKLKDLERDVTVSFQIWSSVKARLPADLKQGDRVVALVKPDYWLKAGSISMQVFQMKHVGLGDLLERLELLRRTLAAEGLFDRSRKRRLPFLPHRIGLITGKDSDAEKDVLRNAQLRWPSVEFRVVHAAVQGDRTVPEVLAALATLEADPEVDVIVIARGGGDFQNLLGFSDERLLRAVAAATTPVVSAIGHENDRPLLDEVADLRASTPTDAAKRIVPDVTEELNGVSPGPRPDAQPADADRAAGGGPRRRPARPPRARRRQLDRRDPRGRADPLGGALGRARRPRGRAGRAPARWRRAGTSGPSPRSARSSAATRSCSVGTAPRCGTPPTPRRARS